MIDWSMGVVAPVKIDMQKGEPSRLDRLTELTETLTLPGSAKAAQSYVEYDVEGGECFGFGLFVDRGGQVAVQRAYMTAGAEFPPHTHDEAETLVVYEGQIEAWIEGEATLLGPGDSITIRPGQRHEIVAQTKARMIGITVPAGGAYPNGRA